jgi:uncharacterized membrane protein
VKAIGIKTDNGYEFYLKRNCSISPIQLAVIFLFLGSISLVIGVVFYIFGATLILPFTFIEFFALVAAYFYNAMHANNYERLNIDKEFVFFESKFGRKYRQEKFIKSLIRVLPSDHEQLVHLAQGLNNIHFGKNLHLTLRPSLETEVRNALRIQAY